MGYPLLALHFRIKKCCGFVSETGIFKALPKISGGPGNDCVRRHGFDEGGALGPDLQALSMRSFRIMFLTILYAALHVNLTRVK